MVEITITEKTSIGAKALKQHIKETKKIRLREKMIFKAAGFKQEVLKEDPIVILLTCNNKYIKYNPMYLPTLLCEIDRALKSNGADKGVDYIVTTDEKPKEVQE